MGVEEEERGQSVCRPLGGEEERRGLGRQWWPEQGGGAAVVAQAHKREGVGSHLQYLSVRASGS